MEREHTNHARERVVADLRALSRDAADLLKATASDMSDKAKDARVRLMAALERAKVSCNELQEKTAATAKAAAKQADTIIRDHPYESLGVAFGVGILVGVLVTRK